MTLSPRKFCSHRKHPSGVARFALVPRAFCHRLAIALSVAAVMTRPAPLPGTESEQSQPLPPLGELASARGKQIGTNFPHLLCVSNQEHTAKKNHGNAHLAYRWRWSVPPAPGTRVLLEAAAPDSPWRELKRHDAAEHVMRQIEGDGTLPGFCTLDGLDGGGGSGGTARVDFEAEAESNFGLALEVIALRLIADSTDD